MAFFSGLNPMATAIGFFRVYPTRHMSAEALSAAVDSANEQENAPALQAEPS